MLVSVLYIRVAFSFPGELLSQVYLNNVLWEKKESSDFLALAQARNIYLLCFSSLESCDLITMAAVGWVKMLNRET